MKQLSKLSAMYKGFLTILFLAIAELGAFAQDSTQSSSSTTTTTTTTTEVWYSQPWVWVVGGAVLLIIIIALVRGGGGTDRVSNTSRTTVIKERE
jgi:hypothetical protein